MKTGAFYACISITITDLPNVMKGSVIQILEGTSYCPVTVVSTDLEANNVRWEKNGTSALQKWERFTITFNNVARADAGNYSVTSSIVCHDDKTKLITESFALDVVCK